MHGAYLNISYLIVLFDACNLTDGIGDQQDVHYVQQVEPSVVFVMGLFCD